MAKPNFPADFLATMLEANADPSIINLGGGLPNARSFPIKAMEAAADKIMRKRGGLFSTVLLKVMHLCVNLLPNATDNEALMLIYLRLLSLTDHSRLWIFSQPS